MTIADNVYKNFFRTFKVEYVRMSESKKDNQKVREVIEDFFLQVIYLLLCNIGRWIVKLEYVRLSESSCDSSHNLAQHLYEYNFHWRLKLTFNSAINLHAVWL